MARGERAQRRTELLSKLEEALPGAAAAADRAIGDGPLLRTGEVALLFGVSEHSIRKWSNEGKLPCIRTLGRHRLFPAHAVAVALRDAIAQEIPGSGAPPEDAR